MILFLYFYYGAHSPVDFCFIKFEVGMICITCNTYFKIFITQKYLLFVNEHTASREKNISSKVPTDLRTETIKTDLFKPV